MSSIELEQRINLLEVRVRFLYDVMQDRIDAAQEEAEALVPDNRSASVKIYPPTIENELDALPPHEGHGGAV